MKRNKIKPNEGITSPERAHKVQPRWIIPELKLWVEENTDGRLKSDQRSILEKIIGMRYKGESIDAKHQWDGKD